MSCYLFHHYFQALSIWVVNKFDRLLKNRVFGLVLVFLKGFSDSNQV